jgi:membrane protein YqaA with SNARE-associated domain
LKNPLDTSEKRLSVSTFKIPNVAINILRIFAVLFVIAITLYIYGIRDHIQDFAAYGYPGIFLIALLANATVLIPAPGIAVVFAMGSIFNPLVVALTAGTGGALGELSGYLAGFGGQAIVERTDIYNRIHPWVGKYGGWAILVFAAVPNPFFDLAGIAAGVSKMPLWRFLLFCWIGQIIKMSIFAFTGAYSLNWLSRFIN